MPKNSFMFLMPCLMVILLCKVIFVIYDASRLIPKATFWEMYATFKMIPTYSLNSTTVQFHTQGHTPEMCTNICMYFGMAHML